MDQYAVVGNPIAHSKSPEIHRLFAEQTGHQLEYSKMLVAKAHFVEEVSAFFALGGKGLNVTVPFKEEAYRFADQLSSRATLAGAVNTLAVNESGNILGDTTDGAGLVADLQRLHWPIAGARILVLGAGGAVRGVLQPLLEQQPAEITICNRTEQKAHQLAEVFGHLGVIQGSGFQQLEGSTFDFIINGTAASLAGELPPLADSLIDSKTRVYDMMYAAEATPFIAWAQARGAQACSDGLGMLVGQAAESFWLWRRVRPELAPVLANLRAQLRLKPA